ncbi:DENN domain-containing protein 2C [Eucyclogobius newberryi]|uniref:DENN domain-containing protein 2C n=1 Tax=Eucyclogobius newberryi TaxID=166745 RepID=UPI003B5A610A
MLALRQKQSVQEGGQIHRPQKGANTGLQAGRPAQQEPGVNIRDKISQWEGRSQQNQDVNLHAPVVSRAYNGNGVCNTKTNISNTSVGLDFREVNLKPTTTGRRSEPVRKYSTEMIIQPDTKRTLKAMKSETLLAQTYTTNAKLSCVLDIELFPKPAPPSGSEEEDGMPAGNFYTSRGFWKKLEGDRLMWEKGNESTGETRAPPKPLRTFQYDGPKDGNRARAQTSPCRLTNHRGSRKLRPPEFPPPPCPVSRTNGISRHKKNRKSFEYEDAERLTAKHGTQGGEARNSGLYHAYSDDNIYEDIVCEMEMSDPYEDIKLSPMCLPIGRSQMPKLPPKPQTLQANSKLDKRRLSSQPLSKAQTLSEGPKTPRRSSTQKSMRTPQYVNKIETIFDERRGRKRVKNQGVLVREETSGTESDPEDSSKEGSRRSVYRQSTLKRRPGYRTLEKDLLQHQQQQLFQIFVVVSLRKGPPGNTYSPEITQQFPKMFDKASRLSKEAEDQLKVIPKFCFPDAQDWKPSAHTPSETFSFVLTGEDGSRWFCYCRKILPSGKGKRLPEVHCIVSKLGCFNLFAKILEEVERRREMSNALVYPFMRSVMEAPFPAPGRTVSVKSFLPGTGNEVLTLTRPVDSRLEHVDFDSLLQCLSVGRLLRVFASLLLERRVIFIADKLSVLSRCSHAVLACLYPFTWQHTFVPVLPASMLDISCSPTPFLIGVLSPCLPELLELPIEEVLIVDLCSDRFVVEMGDEDCILPSKLQAALQQVLEEREAILKQEGDGEHQVDLSSLVSEAFVRFFVELVGHYPLHMVELSNGTKELQRDNFRKSHPSRGVRQLLQLFMETQMFAGFIQDKEMRKGSGRGLFELRVVEYLESYPEPAPSGVNRFLKGLGNKMKLLQIK